MDVREPPRRHGQRRGRQVPRDHPRKDEKARVDDHEVPATVTRPAGPADPAVPARKRLRRRLEQHASQLAPLAVRHEVADVRPEGAPVAEVVVAVDERVPELPALRVRHRLDAQRAQVRERRGDFRLRVRGGGPGRRVDGLHVADAVLPLRRQLEDAVALQRLQHPEAGPDLAGALRRSPAEMLADRLRELVAAVVGQERHRLLDVGDLLPIHAAAREGGRLEVDDSLVHVRLPNLPDDSMRIAGRLSRALRKKPSGRQKSSRVKGLQPAEKSTAKPQVYPNAIALPGRRWRRPALPGRASGGEPYQPVDRQGQYAEHEVAGNLGMSPESDVSAAAVGPDRR